MWTIFLPFQDANSNRGKLPEYLEFLHVRLDYLKADNVSRKIEPEDSFIVAFSARRLR